MTSERPRSTRVAPLRHREQADRIPVEEVPEDRYLP